MAEKVKVSVSRYSSSMIWGIIPSGQTEVANTIKISLFALDMASSRFPVRFVDCPRVLLVRSVPMLIVVVVRRSESSFRYAVRGS